MGSKYIKSPGFQKKTNTDPEKIKKIEEDIMPPLTKILESLENFYYQTLMQLTRQGLSPLQAQKIVSKHIDDYIEGLISIKKSIEEE